MKKNRLVKSKERHKFSISLIFLIIHALKKTFQSFMKWMKTLTISSRIYECMIMKNMEDLNALTGIRRILNFTIMSTTTTKPNHFHYSCCLAIWDPYQEILFILMIFMSSVSLSIEIDRLPWKCPCFKDTVQLLRILIRKVLRIFGEKACYYDHDSHRCSWSIYGLLQAQTWSSVWLRLISINWRSKGNKILQF